MGRNRRIALAALVSFAVAGWSLGAKADDVDAKVAEMLKKVESSVLAKGPHGEPPAPASDLKLSDDEITKIKAMHATAAIVFATTAIDWASAQEAGLKDTFAKLGVSVIAVTDAGFKPDKQVSDIETVLAKKPNIMISIPTDAVATAAAYRKAVDAGVKIVFMDNVANGMVAGKDYISDVSADNYGNGVASALLLAQMLGGKGKVGVVYYAADFFAVSQRHDAFKDTMAKFPGIQIVEEQGIGGPDFAGDAEKAASAILTAHPDLDALWAVWDQPTEGMMSAARALGNTKVIMATCDLGENVSISMAKKGYVRAVGAQRPYDQGVAEATLAGYALLGKEAPPYIVLPALPVTRENLAEAWKIVYHADAPDTITRYLK